MDWCWSAIRSAWWRAKGWRGRLSATASACWSAPPPPGYLEISSALGNAAPSAVLVMPLQHGRNMVGVMELGAFRAFSENELAFVDLSLEAMAIGLEVNITRQRTGALLAETAQQAEELRVQQEELQQSNSELEERADLLERQREEIQRVSAYKSEFMANMSHELRTPLNSMLILSALLKENKGRNLNEKQLEYAGTIHTAGRDLLNLINDILDLAKMEAGKVELHIEPVELAGLCEELQAQFQPQAEQKALALLIERLPGTPAAAQMDRQRVLQVLRNLLANAIKFTHQGSVALRVSVAADQRSFAVSDTGIGVPMDKQVTIFEAFRQADGSISRHYGGTGWGCRFRCSWRAPWAGRCTCTARKAKAVRSPSCCRCRRAAPTTPQHGQPCQPRWRRRCRWRRARAAPAAS